MNKSFLTLFICLFSSISWLNAQVIPSRPDLYTPVYDEISLLSEKDQKLLAERLIKYEDSTSTQIQIVIIDSLRGISVEAYANEWANKWGIGQFGSDNGLLIFIAKSDRKIRIEVGYGLEDKITDAIAAKIIDYNIKPYFKNGEYANGLFNAFEEIKKHLSGYYTKKLKDSNYEIFVKQRTWNNLGTEEWINIICMILFAVAYNYLIFKRFSLPELKQNSKTALFFYVFGTSSIALYIILFGAFIDPESPDIIFHVMIAAALLLLLYKHDKWIKNIDDTLIKIGYAFVLWSVSIALAVLFIPDNFYDIESFMPFVLYGFFIAIGLFLAYRFFMSIKNAPLGSSSGGSSSYSYRSSGYKSYSSSSYKSSYSGSSSKSSYGGGKFGGGGASGSW